jgi:hypothetical protein
MKEFFMVRSKAETQHDQKIMEKEHGRDRARNPTERFAEVGHEGIQRTATASQTAKGALGTGDALANGAQEITAAWARYTEDVMRHTSEASQALLRARTFTEIFEVQGDLLRNNLQAFLEQSARIAEATNRMAMRPFEELRQTSAEQNRD